MSDTRFPSGKSPNFSLLTVFAAVAETLNFTQAAERLGVSKGTVSRSIARLESDVQMELVHRTTHHVALSTAGEQLHHRIRHHLRALQYALSDFHDPASQPSGRLRITVPPDIGLILLPGLLAGFGQRYPAVTLEVHLTSERINLVREGFDVAIRAAPGPLEDSTLIASIIARMSSGWFASPSYLSQHSPPTTYLDPNHSWILHHLAFPSEQLEQAQARFVVDDFILVRELVLEGAGIGAIPTFVAERAVQQGLLEEVSLPAAALPEGKLFLIYPSRGQVPRKLSAFRDFLVESLQGNTPGLSR